MKVSALINRLETLRAEVGDVRVCLAHPDSGWPCDILGVFVDRKADHSDAVRLATAEVIVTLADWPAGAAPVPT